MTPSSTPEKRDSLRPECERRLALVRETCINCPKCRDACAFLKSNGSPREIAELYDPADPQSATLAFQCHLCDLCAAVCPMGVEPGRLFLEMRREAVDRGFAPLPAHKRIMGYEARGSSKRYSWYSLPDGCRTVFFPGCTFSGTRMDTTLALINYLKSCDPQVGVVLDCCGKPSHDLGREEAFGALFGEMKDWLIKEGIRTVLTTCPSCHKVFKTYGAPLEAVSVYEYIREHGLPDKARPRPDTAGDKLAPFAVHDPCVFRKEEAILDAVTELAKSAGFSIEEMPHAGKTAICCGEGGAVNFVKPEFSAQWKQRRLKEAFGHRLLTSCAGCAAFLNGSVPTDHILDAIFHRDAVAAGTRNVTRPPFTYLNRLRLKRYLQNHHQASVTRERDFSPSTEAKKTSAPSAGKIILVLVIAAVIAAVRLTGLHAYLDPDLLRETVSSLGAMAPVAYMLLYAIAPSLFLPGLPLTIAGGILFGPVWGVVYAITGATAGACLAFLISRYMARDWVRARLSGPRWQQLDQSVEKNGWKIVAFTRLVPLFPFNLLNYAFGLTPVRFVPYAVTTFFCMLPACIAYIVFSSSLVDLFKGKLSPQLLIGAGLIVLVSLIPILVKKLNAGKDIVDEK